MSIYLSIPALALLIFIAAFISPLAPPHRFLGWVLYPLHQLLSSPFRRGDPFHPRGSQMMSQPLHPCPADPSHDPSQPGLLALHPARAPLPGRTRWSASSVGDIAALPWAKWNIAQPDDIAGRTSPLDPGLGDHDVTTPIGIDLTLVPGLGFDAASVRPSAGQGKRHRVQSDIGSGHVMLDLSSVSHPPSSVTIGGCRYVGGKTGARVTEVVYS